MADILWTAFSTIAWYLGFVVAILYSIAALLMLAIVVYMMLVGVKRMRRKHSASYVEVISHVKPFSKESTYSR
jgi:hypothetical protein